MADLEDKIPKTGALEKVWNRLKSITSIQEDDHFLVVAIKIFLKIFFISILVLLSPVIIIVLLFAFLLSL